MGAYGDGEKKKRAIRKSGKVVGGYSADFRGYINLNLTDEQKLAYEVWKETAALWDTFEAQIADGVNVAVKLDPKGDGYLASGTQRSELSVNSGLCVTARGGEAFVAWGRLLYCLALLSQHEYWEETQKMADPDRW